MPPHEPFDPNRLDEILNDAVPTALPTRMDLNVEQFMTSDGKIDRDKVYAELGKLIASGNWLVQGFSRVNPDTEGALSGMASVIASLRQLIGEFTKIHNQELKFEQQTQMERIKLDFKMQLQERKHQMDLEKIENWNVKLLLKS